ncbi:hypothetical protein ACIQ4I_08635 [Rummeliibacillus sp. NPDC094406]|uniref:hypothetical protein n=1 Tax=Rummeliibacillus sp. NPDC094406 TaxID=3364511 RepID=UPI0038296BF7
MNRVLSAKKIIEIKNLQSMMTFWGFLIFFLILNFTLATSFNYSVTTFTTSLAVYIFLFISNHILIKNNFHYSIHFGVTRSEFIKASFVSSFQRTIVMVLINIILLLAVNGFTTALNISYFSIFSWSDVFTSHTLIGSNIWIDLCIGTFVSSMAMLSGALQYKWGLFGPLSLAVILLITVTLPSIRSHLFEVGKDVFMHQSLGSFSWLLVASVIVWGCIYLLLQKVDLIRR